MWAGYPGRCMLGVWYENGADIGTNRVGEKRYWQYEKIEAVLYILDL